MIGITGGEPHAVICPTGTRVLYASDWSGAQDGNNLSFSYSLFNFQGQLVANEIEQNSSSFSINKDDLPEGVYFYSLIFSDGSFLNGKIIFN